MRLHFCKVVISKTFQLFQSCYFKNLSLISRNFQLFQEPFAYFKNLSVISKLLFPTPIQLIAKLLFSTLFPLSVHLTFVSFNTLSPFRFISFEEALPKFDIN